MSLDSRSTVVLLADDARLPELLGSGWVVVGESWGARLDLPDDVSLYRDAVERARASRIEVVELDGSAAEEVFDLEAANHADYPFTPATPHAVLSLAETAALWRKSEGATNRLFGARDSTGRLVGVTVVVSDPARPTYAETEFTSVLAEVRGKGVGAAVKAASILALRETGVRRFGTGGAAVNAASLGVNRALGYEVTERWLSLTAPEV